MLPFDGDHPQALSIPSKVCRLCNERKPLEDFPYHTHYRDNRESRCKACCKAYEQNLRRIKKHASSYPKPSNGLCECCGLNPMNCNPPRKWCWDHDHDTERFRGWLCDVCNLSIGQLGDTIDGLMNAVRYLEKANARLANSNLLNDEEQ